MRKVIYSQWEWTDTGLVRNHSLYISYSGPWAMAKKGREIMKQNALDQQAMMKQTQANAQQQYDITKGLQGEEIASTTPGSLSPAATAQLASDRDQIANTYNGIRQTAFRTMGQRGFGSAPSGFTAAAGNAADLGQATQDTAAYRNAQLATERQRQNAMATGAQLTGTEGNQAIGSGNASTGSAVALNKAGSTLGDIIGGAAELAPIVAAPFTGGATLMAAGFNPFSNMGKKPTQQPGSNVGGYNPNSPGAPGLG